MSIDLTNKPDFGELETAIELLRRTADFFDDPEDWSDASLARDIENFLRERKP
jgi:hypothetical protein